VHPLSLSLLSLLFAACWPAAVIGAPKTPVQQYAFKVVRSYAHSMEAYTQGLVYRDGHLYESTGLYGHSEVNVRSFPAGRVLKQYTLPGNYFGEGLAIVDDELIQLTYREGTGFVYDLQTFELRRVFHYKHEGWGLTYDGRQLIASDGSAKLHFINPKTYRRDRSLAVTLAGEPLRNLNELEYINGAIFANVWQKHFIAKIDPQTGYVTATIDLSELAQAHLLVPTVSVLNGIAYRPETKTLLVTGKLWPVLYEIELLPPASVIKE
jgi:glutamine cyclotransferase